MTTFELLDRSTIFGVVVHTIQHEVVYISANAVGDERAAGLGPVAGGRIGYTHGQARQVEVVSTVQGQVGDGLLLDKLPDRSGPALEQRRCAQHHDGFRHGADFELEVEPRDLIDNQGNRSRHGPEALELRRHLIVARRKQRLRKVCVKYSDTLVCACHLTPVSRLRISTVTPGATPPVAPHKRLRQLNRFRHRLIYGYHVVTSAQLAPLLMTVKFLAALS
jgi:hypothetical protein